MMSIFKTSLVLAVGLIAGGCTSPQVDAVKLEGSYQSLNQADESFNAKKFADALATYDAAIKSGVLQADVLAESYLKRACCKIETGDLPGAAEDLDQAERGGAVGDEYQQALKRLSEKKSRS